MKLLVYESRKEYDLSGEPGVSSDPIAGQVIHGCYGAIIFPKAEKAPENYCEMLKSLQIKETKSLDFKIINVDLRDYIGPSGPQFTLSSFCNFLRSLKHVTPHEYGLYIWGREFNRNNLVWDIYEVVGLLFGHPSFLGGFSDKDMPERLGLSIKLDSYPDIQILLRLPTPWRKFTEKSISCEEIHAFKWTVDLGKVENFFKTKHGIFMPPDYRVDSIRALSFYLSPLTPSPITKIIVDVFQQYYNKYEHVRNQYCEELLKLQEKHNVIYISKPDKPFESILNDTRKVLIEELSAIGLQYRGRI